MGAEGPGGARLLAAAAVGEEESAAAAGERHPNREACCPVIGVAVRCSAVRSRHASQRVGVFVVVSLARARVFPPTNQALGPRPWLAYECVCVCVCVSSRSFVRCTFFSSARVDVWQIFAEPWPILGPGALAPALCRLRLPTCGS